MSAIKFNICFNPFGLKHKKRKISDLRPVPEWIRKLYANVDINAKICSSCRIKMLCKKNKNEHVIKEHGEEVFVPKEEALKALNKFLELIGEPKILIKSENFESYIRYKVDNMKKSILKKVFGFDEIEKENMNSECNLINVIKEVHDENEEKSVKAACVKILSTKYSNNKICDELPTSSMYFIKKAKKTSNLVAENIINTNSSENVHEMVKNFYCDDEYSRVMPGKKDYKSVKVNYYIF